MPGKSKLQQNAPLGAFNWNAGDIILILANAEDVVTTGQSFVFLCLPLKTFLQGAFNSGLTRHKDVTADWASVLNTSALNQPYSTSPFNYAGTENVSAGFFTNTAANTDIVDWVLLELRDTSTSTAVIKRRTAFIREDGMIRDLDGISPVNFNLYPPAIADGAYHLVIRHRNHLAIRTANPLTLSSGTLQAYDFTTAQAQAYQNPAITVNSAQKNLMASVFGMWGGNANGMTTGTNAINQVKISAPNPSSDYFFLFNTTLGGNIITVLSNVYHPADLNMDGQVKATAPNNTSDYFFLFNIVLSGGLVNIWTQHQ